jgi:hypothetical protein
MLSRSYGIKIKKACEKISKKKDYKVSIQKLFSNCQVSLHFQLTSLYINK